MADTNINNQSIKIVCPSANELSVIVNNVKCNQCGLVFKNESRFRFHHVKTHERKKLEKMDKMESTHYHCPEKTCIYSPTSQRFFTTMKYLKQHYLKVHADKRYSCNQCEKSFSTEAAQLAHMRICGLEFTCDCLKTFTSYEALLTHARRHSHHVDEKYRNILRRTNLVKLSSPAATKVIQIPVLKKPITILPYKEKLETIKSNEPSTCDSSTQTDDLKKIKKSLAPSKASRRRESRQTQTNSLSKEKRCRKTVETQTTSSHRESIKKSNLNRKIKQTSLEKNDVELNTFTNNLFSSSPSSMQLSSDIEIADFWEERNSLGTQTSPDKNLLDLLETNVPVQFYQNDYTQDNYYDNITTRISDPMLTEETFINDRFSSIETQTEKSYNQEIIFDDFELTSTNIETQTTENFDNIEQLFYTNMCTQTCNEILPSELGLSDTQTQTAWPELETTTNDSTQQNHQFVDIQISHTETQTDDFFSIFHKLQ